MAPGLILEEESPREASSLLLAEMLFLAGRLYKHFAPSGLKKTDQKAIFDYVKYVKIASVAFWDAYLKTDAHVKAYPKSNSLIDYSRNSVKLSWK